MKEKVQSILSWEERVSSCTLSTGLPGRCIVVAIPCGRHAWADHHIRFHSQSHSPTKSYTGRSFGEATWEEARGGRARRATIKALPATLHRPRFTGVGFLEAGCRGAAPD